MRTLQGRTTQPFLCEHFWVELHNIMRTLQGRTAQQFLTYYATPSGSSCTTIFNLLCGPFKVELHNHIELIMRTLQGRAAQPYFNYRNQIPK